MHEVDANTINVDSVERSIISLLNPESPTPSTKTALDGAAQNKTTKGDWTKGVIDHRWALSLVDLEVMVRCSNGSCIEGYVTHFRHPLWAVHFYYQSSTGCDNSISLDYNELKCIINQDQSVLTYTELPDTPKRVLKLSL